MSQTSDILTKCNLQEITRSVTLANHWIRNNPRALAEEGVTLLQLLQVEMDGVREEGLPSDLSITFTENKFTGHMRTTPEGKQRTIRGIKWGN